MRVQQSFWTVSLAACLGVLTAASADAQSLPLGDLVGSWSATSFLVSDAAGGGGPADMVAAGGAVWMTIDPNQQYVVTTQNPGVAVREAETGNVRVVSATRIEFQGFGASDWQPFIFAFAGDDLSLSGQMPLDLDGDGEPEPANVEIQLAREAPKTGDGDGVPGAWVRSSWRVRTYRMHVPTTLVAGRPAPVVLFFHGHLGNARDIQAFTGFDAVADSRGFIAVYVNGVDGSWAVGCDCTSADVQEVDDVRLVRSLIAQLERDGLVDVSRVYAVGYSQGSMFSHRLACELSDRLAGVATVAGGMARLVSPGCSPERPISMVMLHGTADESVPWWGSERFLSIPGTADRWAQLNGCAGKAVEPLPDLADDGTTVTRETWSNCAAGTETVLYEIHDGGHTWPGSPLEFNSRYGNMTRDISASEVIGELFSRHSLAPQS